MLPLRLPYPRRSTRPTHEVAMPTDHKRWRHLAAAGLALSLSTQGDDTAALAAVTDPFDPPPMPRPTVVRPEDADPSDDEGELLPHPQHLLPEEPQA